MNKLIDKFDLQLYLGTGLIAYGIWQVFKPAAFIFVGAALLVFAYLDVQAKRLNGGR
jgi:hypothetical protein